MDIITSLDFTFSDDNDTDSRVATALLVGIATDTENLMSDDTTEYEFRAWSQLFPFRDSIAMKQIVNFERPKTWIEMRAEAVSKARIEEGVGVVGLGVLPAKHRDLVADMAQYMVSWEDINTAVVFAVVDGNRIEGSVRSNSPSVSVPALSDALGGRHGKGGGKPNKGAYRYDLAGASIEEDDDEQTKNMAWDLFNEKETKRIFRLIRSK
jgi:nanoRNase/pAp phosphatase (c-di-AMP/oligoRNAs hydrolase)